MKKFMKGSAIAGLVCLLVGVVIFAIGALGGGMKYMNKSNTTPLQNIVHLAKDFGVVEISGMNISFGTDTINNKIFDNNQEKYYHVRNEYINSFEKNSASKIAKIIYDENK